MVRGLSRDNFGLNDMKYCILIDFVSVLELYYFLQGFTSPQPQNCNIVVV